MPPLSDQARWFSDEVVAHEAHLKAYLRAAFPRARAEVNDVVQESYLRVWRAGAARSQRPLRALLFRVASNVALDLLRRMRVSPVEFMAAPETLPVAAEAPSAAAQLTRAELIAALIDGIAALPPRGREVVVLRKFQGLSQRETAARLGIAEKTVDEHLARSLRRLGDHLAALGIAGSHEQ